MRFNIRVYGLIINEEGEVLLSDEYRFGTAFTKFPGGGLEWGEGTREGLQREILEELGLDCVVGDLVYVNDFFQRSAFRETDQIISFYYKVDYIVEDRIDLRSLREKDVKEGEAFRWVKIDQALINELTFPIDKKCAELLILSEGR